MAATTLSENIVAALVLGCRGDTSMSLASAVDALERWLEENDRHFGLGRRDVRSSLHTLWFEDADLRSRSDRAAEVLSALSLADALPILLKYKHYHANDEGDHWETVPSGRVDERTGRVSSVSFRAHSMRRFFAGPDAHSPSRTVRFLRKLGFTEAHLLASSRPGASS